jgi:hypothetical protein
VQKYPLSTGTNSSKHTFTLLTTECLPIRAYSRISSVRAPFQSGRKQDSSAMKSTKYQFI